MSVWGGKAISELVLYLGGVNPQGQEFKPWLGYV